MSKITFKTIQTEKDIDKLYQYKIDLTNEISGYHMDLHNGNASASKSEILADLNECKELLEYANSRLQTRRNEIYIENKERNQGLRKFKDLVKLHISPELFAKLDAESKAKN
jgi:hypothetical protein